MFKHVASATALVLSVTGAALAQSPGNAVVFAIFENPQPHHGCIVSERDRDGGYDNLVLGRCDSPAARFVFDERAKRIRSAARPNLCVGDTTGAGAAPFGTILRDCAPDGVGQFYTYNRGRRLIVGLTEDNREERDGFCLYVGPQRGQRTAILAEPCQHRRPQAAHTAFFITPASAVSAAGTGAPSSPPPQSAPMTSEPRPPQASPASSQLTRSPWGQSGPWTIDASSTPAGFSTCRAVRQSDSGEIRIGLNAQLDMTMSTPADRATAPPGTRANVVLRAGRDRETVPGSVNSEGRLAFTVPPPIGRTMVETNLREMFVEGPDGMSVVPIAGFRALWDALNACVSAQGRR